MKKGEVYPHRFEFAKEAMHKDEKLEISSLDEEFRKEIWGAMHNKKIRQISGIPITKTGRNYWLADRLQVIREDLGEISSGDFVLSRDNG